MKVLTEVFRSPRRDEMYLYIDKQKGMKEVPEELLEYFGQPQAVMTLLLTPAKKLARAEAKDVCLALMSKGYYLQMPPAREEYLLDLYRAPTESRY
ncbi:YcgL domain-containing protein [Marinospirillum perlucidum]|uniref:YcgL domain-containing protein n=1 Tax=Marinospirillum perlucidum TaxID=1982602 RepID=UPI000DF15B4C|nr:YcgL domain-containing protein [Marinospirillum perlucidum]